MKKTVSYQASDYMADVEVTRYRIELKCLNCKLTRPWHITKGIKIHPSRLKFLKCPVCWVKGMLIHE